MASPSPKNLAAVLHEKGTPLSVEELPMPKLLEGKDMIIRVRSAAMNPVDHVRQTTGFLTSSYPAVLGWDACGTVYSTGPDVTVFKPGDRVTCWPQFLEHMEDNNSTLGAFQTYMLANEATASHIPDSMSFGEGATFPMTVLTNAAAFFITLGLPRPKPAAMGPSNPAAKVNSKHGILIWSAASSIGCMAVQMAAQMGFTVYATASRKHHDMIKRLGATAVWDYREENIADRILEHSNKSVPVAMVYDIWSKKNSLDIVFRILQGSTVKTHVDGSSLKVAHAGPPQWLEGVEIPDGIDVKFVTPEGSDTVEFSTWITKEYFRPKLRDGSFVPAPPVKLMTGRLTAIDGALDYVRQGNVSGEKVVVNIE